MVARSGECDNEWCRSRRGAHEAELAALRRELQRARDRAAQMQREIQHKAELVNYNKKKFFTFFSA